MKKILLFIFGVCWLVMGFAGFLFGTKPLNATICLVLGIISLFIALSKRNTKPASTIHKSYNGFRVAGVTFQNEDGTERQYLLKKLYFHDKPFDGDLSIELERYLWEDKPAYYVKVNGYTIGSVEASVVYYFEENSGRPLKNEIEVHFGKNGIYSAEISGKFLDVTE